MDTVGKRIKKIRQLRGWTQKKTANEAGIHEVLLQKYEREESCPREEQLIKIAHALLVPVDFLRAPVSERADVLIYNLLEQYGDIGFIASGTPVAAYIPSWDRKSASFDSDMFEIQSAKESGLTNEELKLWLLNHEAASLRRAGTMELVNPDLVVTPKAGAIPPPRPMTFQDKFIAVMGTERKLESAVDIAYHEIIDRGTDEETKKILDKLLRDVRNLVDEDKSKFD